MFLFIGDSYISLCLDSYSCLCLEYWILNNILAYIHNIDLDYALWLLDMHFASIMDGIELTLFFTSLCLSCLSVRLFTIYYPSIFSTGCLIFKLRLYCIYTYLYIHISVYKLHMYIYISFSDTLLPPVIYVSAIFHAARWRVHKPRSAVACNV